MGDGDPRVRDLQVRMGQMEVRMGRIEIELAESRGAQKVYAGLAALLTAILTSAAVTVAQHLFGK